MSRSGWSTSNYLSYSSGVVTASPLTMACWAKTSVTSTLQFMVALHNTASTTNLNSFNLRVTTTDNIGFSIGDGSTSTNATSAGTITANTWFHACGVADSATAYRGYLNGVAGADKTTSHVPSGINVSQIGATDTAGTPINPFAPAGTGLIAFAAIWNIALSGADVAALATGADPTLIHPEALVAFWPLIGVNSPENNLLSNTSVMTITGSLSQGTEPALFRAG